MKMPLIGQESLSSAGNQNKLCRTELCLRLRLSFSNAARSPSRIPMIAITQSIVEKVQDGKEQRLIHRPVFSPAASEGYPSEQRLLLDDGNDTVDPPTPLLLHSTRGFLYLTPAEQ